MLPARLWQSYNAKAARNGAINIGKKILASKMSKSLKAKVAGLSSVRRRCSHVSWPRSPLLQCKSVLREQCPTCYPHE